MIKKRNIFDETNRKAKRLKLAKRVNDKLRISSQNKQSLSSKFVSHGISYGKNASKVQVAGATVVVKSNYQIAGRRYKDGIASRKDIGSHASASLSYMNNHGSEDIRDENLSNIYDETGERLSKEQLGGLMKSLERDEENQAMRRTVISIDKEGLNREDLSQIVRESMHDFMSKTDNTFDFKYAIHTDTDHIHAHVLATGDARDIMISKEQMKELKITIAEKTEERLIEKKLDHDRSIDKIVDKAIEQEKDKNLTLNQQIDKQLDGKLDDKFREEELEKLVKEVYEQSHTNNNELTR